MEGLYLVEEESFLVIGLVDVSSIARSAREAGHQVCTVDLFGDLDTRRYSDASLSIIGEGGSAYEKGVNLPEILVDLAERLIRKKGLGSILLASGLDDEKHTLQSLNDLAPITGNPPQIITRVRDRIVFFDELRRLKISFPETRLVCDLNECLCAAKDIGFPLIIKPTIGYGGRGVVKVDGKEHLKKIFNKALRKPRLVQEYIPGKPASISIIADGQKSDILTINEQLLGMKELGQEEEFAYCGNIVPLDVNRDLTKKSWELASKLTAQFGLKGSNGIDVVFSRRSGEIFVIEVNPRFQGSMECVERHLGLNLVVEHLKACQSGEIGNTIRRVRSGNYVRTILFAGSRFKAPDLTSYNFVRDIPLPGSEIGRGDPICSIMAHSLRRNSCLNEAKRRADIIFNVCR